jgi:hypothetical protein
MIILIVLFLVCKRQREDLSDEKGFARVSNGMEHGYAVVEA